MKKLFDSICIYRMQKYKKKRINHPLFQRFVIFSYILYVFGVDDVSSPQVVWRFGWGCEDGVGGVS